MSTKFRNTVSLVILLAISVPGRAGAQVELGTRASGMAGAFVAVADDASAVYWNPAGIATGSLISVIVSAGSGTSAPGPPEPASGERSTGRIVALSATAIGLAYYGLGTYGTSAPAPAVTGLPGREDVRRSVHAVTTSVAAVSLLQSLSEHLVVGVTPKLIRGRALLGESTALDVHDALDAARDLRGPASTRFDVDAGAMFYANGVRVGIVGRNLTAPSFDQNGVAENEIELGRELRIGAAWGSGGTGTARLVIAADGDVLARDTPLGARRDLAAGVETWWRDRRLGLRGGIRQSTIGAARAAVAAGVSAGLSPGLLLEAHAVRGQDGERSWSVGARMSY